MTVAVGCKFIISYLSLIEIPLAFLLYLLSREVQLAVVEALILPPGTIQFDSLTKTNMVQRTIKHLTASDVKKLSNYITKRIVVSIHNLF